MTSGLWNKLGNILSTSLASEEMRWLNSRVK